MLKGMMILKKPFVFLTPNMMGKNKSALAFRLKYFFLPSVICAEELMSVMISLGNPRTEEEIKVMYFTIFHF